MPKVSIITPTTHNRDKYNDLCAEYARKQDYSGEIEHLWDYDEGSIGEKLNRLCKRATGEIIIRFDSDDFYSREWVSISVAHLLLTGAEITGISSAYFFNPYGACYKYSYRGRRPHVLGGSMCFTKKAWENEKFKHISNGEDYYFAFYKKCVVHQNIHHFCALVHSNNTTSQRKFFGRSFSQVDKKIPQMIMGEDFHNYPV